MVASPAPADEFTKEDLARWEQEYTTVVQKGRELWTSPTLGANGVACAQCHPNAPTRTPRPTEVPEAARPRDRAARDDQLVPAQPLEGHPGLDDPRMVAIEAYCLRAPRVALAPGKH